MLMSALKHVAGTGVLLFWQSGSANAVLCYLVRGRAQALPTMRGASEIE